MGTHLVQTFLPYADFALSAASLDRQRLGKQRVENLQIMRALLDPTSGWQNHPAVVQWRGYEMALIAYQAAVCLEWTTRGYKDTCFEKTRDLWSAARTPGIGIPEWLGDERLHLSHRSNLVRKNPEHYGPQFPDADPAMPYWWPSKEMV